MELMAIRAYIILKFNPHPVKSGESALSWAKVADKLFLHDGKCRHRFKDETTGENRECGLSKHQYNSKCVRALQSAVGRLTDDMENARIPI